MTHTLTFIATGRSAGGGRWKEGGWPGLVVSLEFHWLNVLIRHLQNALRDGCCMRLTRNSVEFSPCINIHGLYSRHKLQQSSIVSSKKAGLARLLKHKYSVHLACLLALLKSIFSCTNAIIHSQKPTYQLSWFTGSIDMVFVMLIQYILKK